MKRTLMAVLLAGLSVSASAAPAAPPQAAAPSADATLSLDANAAFLADNAKRKGVIIKPDGLQFRIIQNGFGKRPAGTDTVTVYYTGKLINGMVFDGTSPGLPATFKVSDVIPGWIQALQMMREGDHWQIVIPAALGYGSRGAGDSIPPGQTLIFDMTLIATTPAPKKGDKGYVPQPGDEDQQ